MTKGWPLLPRLIGADFVGELLAALQKPKPSRCPVAKVLQHPEHGPDLLEALAAHPAITYVDIAAELQNYGFYVSTKSLGHHQRGLCSCG